MKTTTGHSRLDSLLDLYLSGRIDKAALEELKKLTLESDANRTYVREYLDVWLAAGTAVPQNNRDFLDRKFKEIEQRIDENECEAETHVHLFRKWGVWAAAVVLAMLLPLGGYLWGVHSSSTGLSGTSLETALGARTMVYLPDSTLVWLNAGSKLVYASGYGITNRKVSLQGEALFDVRHNEKLPFEINSEDVDLRVLGTRFVFSNYPDDKQMKVDLVRGRVFLKSRLKDGGNVRELYLSPNERMVFDKRTGYMQKQPIDASMSDSWTMGRLFFDEVPLAEIAKELSRSYNVRIRVLPAMQDAVFYGSFDMKQNTLEDILRTIASTKQMKYRYKDGEYILY